MHMRMAFCIEKRNFPSLIFKEYLDITHLDEQEILGKGLKLMSESQYSMVVKKRTKGFKCMLRDNCFFFNIKKYR